MHRVFFHRKELENPGPIHCFYTSSKTKLYQPADPSLRSSHVNWFPPRTARNWNACSAHAYYRAPGQPRHSCALMDREAPIAHSAIARDKTCGNLSTARFLIKIRWNRLIRLLKFPYTCAPTSHTVARTQWRPSQKAVSRVVSSLRSDAQSSRVPSVRILCGTPLTRSATTVTSSARCVWRAPWQQS